MLDIILGGYDIDEKSLSVLKKINFFFVFEEFASHMLRIPVNKKLFIA